MKQQVGNGIASHIFLILIQRYNDMDDHPSVTSFELLRSAKGVKRHGFIPLSFLCFASIVYLIIIWESSEKALIG